MKQAEKIAEKLKNISFNEVITSPLFRAKQTAELICKISKHNLLLQEKDWLSEINLGQWLGSKKEDIIEKHPELDKNVIKGGYSSKGPLITRLLKFNKDFQFPSGESLKEFWKRVILGFNDTLDKYKGGSNNKIALIGHGGSFTIIILSLLGYKFGTSNFPIFLFRMGDSTLLRIEEEQLYFLNLNSFYLSNTN